MFFALTVCGVLLMMVLFALGLDADMVALSLGICLVALHGAMAARCDASTRRGEEEEPTNQGEDDGGNTFSRCGTKVDDTSTEVLAAMDYPLLLLFIGQFVLVAALVRTGLPSQLWEATIDTWCRTSPSGTASCATALSNVISNVPFVLMVTPSLARPSGLAAAASAAAAAAGLVDATGGGNRERDWAVISFVATVAGNFLITGSAANLIVASGAERAGYRGFTTGRHALFGIPSTMLVIAAGVPILLETYNLW
jgi:Na+/H+ antiporter NhaD/arsenite permease-like protein